MNTPLAERMRPKSLSDYLVKNTWLDQKEV